MSTFTTAEKSRIFVERTQDLWPDNWNRYLELVKHELWTKKELDAYNFKRRVEILTYAYENTAFYKRLYDEAGLKPQDVRTEADWEKVPIVTKQMIADNSSDFEVKEDIGKYGFIANTGGSTGKPLRVFRDRRHFWQAPYWRFYGWHLGRTVGNPETQQPLWGMDQSYIGRDQYRFSEVELRQRQVSFWPIQYSYLSCYSDFSTEAPRYLEEIAKSPMLRIYAYAGGMDMLTDYCLKNGKMGGANIAFVECCASPVTNILREKVRKVFGCDVFDFYASNEMGPMAIECCRSGADHHLHVLSDILHIELVDDKDKTVKPGEDGTTVVTCFDNKVFPFVRYNHGDITHYIDEPCECGLPFPCIAPVRGRKSDYLITLQGDKIDGVGFNEVFDFNPDAALAFQFRQRKNGQADFLVVPNNAYSKSCQEINEIFAKLQKDFAEKIVFSLQLVDTIQHDGGKARYIVHE